MEKRIVALNNHTETSVCQSALDQWVHLSQKDQISLSELNLRYQTIYDLLGSSYENDFIFTSSSAEAINQVFFSLFLEKARKEGRCHFIASCLEDAPTMQMLKRLEELGCYVKIAPVTKDGQIDLAILEKLISPRTAAISVKAADGLTGVIQPFEEIAQLAKEREVLFHLEASYAIGKIDLIEADYVTFSGERIHSVKSSGGVMVKKGAPLTALILGGAEQKGLRGGPLDMASFVALSVAAQQALLFKDQISLETARLKNLLEDQLKERIGAKIHFPQSLQLPNTSTIHFEGVHQEALHFLLKEQGIYTSLGGAFNQHLSSLLAASEIDGISTLSFSLSRMINEDDIFYAVGIICDSYHNLKKLSEDL